MIEICHFLMHFDNIPYKIYSWNRYGYLDMGKRKKQKILYNFMKMED